MITKIQITGIGPHKTTSLDVPAGRVVFAGAPQTGKTSTIDAVCLALWGTDRFGRAWKTERIDGACSVSLTLSTGMEVHRGKSDDGAFFRAVQGKNGTEQFSSEAALSARLGSALGNSTLCRAIFAPGILDDEDLPSRIAAATKSDRGSIIAELGGDPGFPYIESKCTEDRRNARRTADRSAADVAAIRGAQPGADVPTTPADESALTSAKKTLEAAQKRVQWEAANAGAVAWDRQAKEIGECKAMRADIVNASNERDRTGLQLSAAKAEHERLHHMSVGTCGACGQKVPVLPDVLRRLAEATATMEAAIEADVVARARLVGATASEAKRRSLEILGPRPVIGEEPPIIQAAEVSAAAAVLKHAEKRAIETAYLAEERKNSALKLAKAERIAKVAGEAFTLAEKNLAIARQIPILQAERATAALQLPAEIGIVWGKDQTITLNGCPAKYLSSGARIYLDALLRAAIRRAAKMPWLPIAIDDCVLWGPISIDNTWQFQTTDSKELTCTTMK